MPVIERNRTNIPSTSYVAMLRLPKKQYNGVGSSKKAHFTCKKEQEKSARVIKNMKMLERQHWAKSLTTCWFWS